MRLCVLLVICSGLAFATPSHAQDPTFTSDFLSRVVDGEGMLPARWRNREEVLAYEQLVLHARQFPPAVLSRSARHDLRLPLLLGPDKANYRGALIHLEGSLRLLETMELSAGLTGMAEGLTNVYRGWIALDGYKDDLGPVLCAVDFTELPTGLTAANAVDRHVTVDGYFFKVMKYDTREAAPAGVTVHAPEGKVARLAPLLVARSIQVQTSAATAANSLWEVPAAVVTGAILLILAAGAAWLAVSWWLKREDARVRARLQRLRPRAFANESAADAGFNEISGDDFADRGPLDHSPSAN
jgi:hypothetical protein